MKINVYPCNPKFYCIKVGFNGVKTLYRHVFVMLKIKINYSISGSYFLCWRPKNRIKSKICPALLRLLMNSTVSYNTSHASQSLVKVYWSRLFFYLPSIGYISIKLTSKIKVCIDAAIKRRAQERLHSNLKTAEKKKKKKEKKVTVQIPASTVHPTKPHINYATYLIWVMVWLILNGELCLPTGIKQAL